MNQSLLQQAENLARRPYLIEITRDETTENELVYVARNPELEGCMAQGETEDIAEANLLLARVDYIYSLLEDSQPIPEPATTNTTTASASSVTVFVRSPGQDRKVQHHLEDKETHVYVFA